MGAIKVTDITEFATRRRGDKRQCWRVAGEGGRCWGARGGRGQEEVPEGGGGETRLDTGSEERKEVMSQGKKQQTSVEV